MRKELEVKTRSLAGSSDLTLFAPIKPGLVPSLEAVSYKTRLRLLLKTLNGARSSSAEYALVRPFSDAVERVGVIQSVRLAIVEPEDKLMLAATFDGAWETYIRVLWQKVGTLLDVIFCHTVDYVSAYGNSHEAWADWARRVQAQTEFFYGMPGLTVDDVHYLRADERLHREFRPSAEAFHAPAAAQSVASAEARAWSVATGIAPAEQGSADAKPLLRNAYETGRQGMQGLALLYRLTEYFPSGTEDGAFLHRAARDLLLEFRQLFTPGKYGLPENAEAQKRFERQLGWLFGQEVTERDRPPTGAPPVEAAEVQGGILCPYEGVTHGCLLLIGLASRAAGARLLAGLCGMVTAEDHDAGGQTAPGPFVNVALTHEGLRRLGLEEAELARFPAEFRQGMEARAGILGDLRHNHPRRWRLPLRNWPGAPAQAASDQEVELAAVHVVVHLRLAGDGRSWHEFENVGEAAHPLHAVVQRILAFDAGVSLLSVQPMRRNFNDEGQPVEHFGFVDGLSQPVPGDAPYTGRYCDTVPLGDLLLGHANEADPTPARRDPLLHNGSFLVVRKLRQDVEALEKALAAVTGAPDARITREELLGKMMGRAPDGKPLVAAAGGKDFDYGADPEGRLCPFQAHVRRANPRSPQGLHVPPGGRRPRIMRRGMSYGPRYEHGAPETLSARQRAINAEERGIVFMAYNASIAEQFEPIQRWLAGGNSSGVLSGQSDPFLGVPTHGDPRTFRFDHQGEPVRMDLDLPGAQPFVRLEWGAYLFVPSIPALGRLAERAADGTPPQPVWSADEGLRSIERLASLPRDVDAKAQWKLALEEADRRRRFDSAAVWAAIRKERGGVLRTPYGVLVGGRDAVMAVLEDRHGRYSVRGYQARMAQSIGEIYLGMDRQAGRGCPYERESADANAAIQAIGIGPAFEATLALARQELEAFRAVEVGTARALGLPTWELNLDLRELIDKVLAGLSEQWFGLSEDGGHFMRGAVAWNWRPGMPPSYPGHFIAPSRYIFQPHPDALPAATGQAYGQALRGAMRCFVEAQARPQGPIATAIHKTGRALFPKDVGAQNDWIARNLVGVLMGMLPTLDGSLRAVLNEWLVDGTFWRLRSALPQGGAARPLAQAEALLRPELERAMQLRPVPEMVWRTATAAHDLGPVRVRPGDLVVLGLVSATQQTLEEGESGGAGAGVAPIFGGMRAGNGAPKSGGPTHACPGREAAMGTMLGLAMALLETKDTVRPSPAPVALTFTGPMP